jgi:membrane-associated protein
MQSLIHFVTDPRALIAASGMIGVIVIIFLETGFFFGFFFPGDSLLFTAGLLVSTGYLTLGSSPFLSLIVLLVGVFLAAVAGDSVGYAFGRKVGPALFKREDSRFFSKEHLARAQHFYDKYGARTIIIARFVPIVRTFAPIVAGVGQMEYKKFLRFNVIGGLAWTLLLIGLGFGFGHVIPEPDRYLLPAIGVIIILSILPAVREYVRQRRASK